MAPKQEKPLKVVKRLGSTYPKWDNSWSAAQLDPGKALFLDVVTGRARQSEIENYKQPPSQKLSKGRTYNKRPAHPTARSFEDISPSGAPDGIAVEEGIIPEKPPVLLKSAVDDTWHAHPAGTSNLDIEKYDRKYVTGQTLPPFAFSPEYDAARDYYGERAYRPPRLDDLEILTRTREPQKANPVTEYYLPGVGVTYLDQEFASKLSSFIARVQARGIPLNFLSGYRDRAHQRNLDPRRTAVRPAANSLHSAGRAVDIDGSALFKDEAMRAILIEEAKRVGLDWGGYWKGRKYDPNHFYLDPGSDRRALIDRFAMDKEGLINEFRRGER